MSRFIPENVLLAIADFGRGGTLTDAALRALAGDETREYTLTDWLEENDAMLVNPFEVGRKYLICTVTLYYVGEVVESGFGWVRLKDASWVHWTGRLSVLLSGQSFTKGNFGSRKPRTEYCGETIISTSAVSSAYPWTGELPRGNVE